MKKFTRIVSIFIMIIFFPFCMGGCTLFVPKGDSGNNGNGFEDERPADNDLGSDDTSDKKPSYDDYYGDEFYKDYRDAFSGIDAAYLPKNRNVDNKQDAFFLAREKFNNKIIEQYSIMSKYILYSLLNIYGFYNILGDTDNSFQFNLDIGENPIINFDINTRPNVNEFAMFTTNGGIEYSIDGIKLSPPNPSTQEDSLNAKLVPNYNNDFAWKCNLNKNVSQIDNTYNDEYIEKFAPFLQIRLMETYLSVQDVTTLGEYNKYYKTELLNEQIMSLAKCIKNIGVDNQILTKEKIYEIIAQEIIGEEAILNSDNKYKVIQEYFEWTIPKEITYSLGEICYNDSGEIILINAKNIDGKDIIGKNGEVVQVPKLKSGELLYYENGNPVLVHTVDKNQNDILVQAIKGTDYVLQKDESLDYVETTSFHLERDINNNGSIEKELYQSKDIYNYNYYQNINNILTKFMEKIEKIPFYDDREMVVYDASKYFSPIKKPNENENPLLTNMEYLDYNSFVLYNMKKYYPVLLSISIEGHEDLDIDLYFRFTINYKQGNDFVKATQLVKLGEIHTVAEKPFDWEGDAGNNEIPENDKKANTKLMDLDEIFGAMLPNSGQDGEIDWNDEKYSNYLHYKHLMENGLNPTLDNDGNVIKKLVPGDGNMVSYQGIYQGVYDKYLMTSEIDTLVKVIIDSNGKSKTVKEGTTKFSHQILIKNVDLINNDCGEFIFDVKNIDKVSDSSFRFLYQNLPNMQDMQDSMQE